MIAIEITQEETKKHLKDINSLIFPKCNHVTPFLNESFTYVFWNLFNDSKEIAEIESELKKLTIPYKLRKW